MVMVRLLPEIEEYVRSQVENGAAASAEDYVNELLKAEQEKAQDTDDKFWSDVQLGMDDIDAGNSSSVEDAFESVRRELGLKASKAR
jgi:antitoxin ParD1/3/4